MYKSCYGCIRNATIFLSTSTTLCINISIHNVVSSCAIVQEIQLVHSMLRVIKILQILNQKEKGKKKKRKGYSLLSTTNLSFLFLLIYFEFEVKILKNVI